MPRNSLKALALCGRGNRQMNSTRSGNGSIPCAVTRWARKSTISSPNRWQLVHALPASGREDAGDPGAPWNRGWPRERPQQTWSGMSVLHAEELKQAEQRYHSSLLYISSSQGIWLYPRTKSTFEKIFIPFNERRKLGGVVRGTGHVLWLCSGVCSHRMGAGYLSDTKAVLRMPVYPSNFARCLKLLCTSADPKDANVGVDN